MRINGADTHMKTALSLLLVCGSLASAATDETTTHMAGRDVKKPGPPGYQEVTEEDKAMDGAVAKARESLGFFLAALNAKKPDTGGFEVKKPFVEGEKVEHIWVSDITWDGKAFRGRVDNKPLDVSTVRLGQRVTVTPEDLSDWMFVKDGKLMGGFTIRLLYARLSAGEKAQFRKQAEFKIE